MTRIKGGVTAKKKHKKILKITKGYRGTKSKLFKLAQEAALHAGQYAYHGRKLKKRDKRREWILRIGEAVKQEGIPYSKFIFALKKSNIEIDRKILSDLIISDPGSFKAVVDKIKNII